MRVQFLFACCEHLRSLVIQLTNGHEVSVSIQMKVCSLGCKWIVSAVLLGLSSLRNEKYIQACKIVFPAAHYAKKAQLIYTTHFEKKSWWLWWAISVYVLKWKTWNNGNYRIFNLICLKAVTSHVRNCRCFWERAQFLSILLCLKQN